MERVQLAQFFQAVQSWPRSEAEISLVSERLCQLIQVPFAAVQSDEGGVIGHYFEPVPGLENLSAGVIHDYLKNQFQALSSSVPRTSVCLLREAHVPEASYPWSPILRAGHLGFVHLCGDLHDGLVPRGSQRHRDFGWVVIASLLPLRPEQSTILLAAAQHLAELALMNELESLIRLRSQFLSIASHELKTPLTSIYGVLQLQDRMLKLKKDESPESQIERQQSFLKMVIRQVERLNELIDGLLDVSRIQSGRFVVEPADTDVAELLKETVEARLEIIAQEAGVKIHVESPPNLSAWVDPLRIEEVITNLGMNAIRFSPEGGVVWIKLRDEGSSFRITIRDQGPSVPSEDRERIFLPFERAQRTSRLGGLGLGLFISRQIALIHGGNVSLVESVPGKGNVFEAYFPTRNVSLISASA